MRPLPSFSLLLLLVPFTSATIGGCDEDEETNEGGSGGATTAETTGQGGAGGGQGGEGGGVAPLVWGPCDTSDWVDGYPKPVAGVECTTVDVPLDYAAPDGATMPLRVARQMSNAFPTGKAVFNLAGGPGGGAVTQSGIIPIIQSELLEEFDLVYVDQRGTGGSGYLGCPGGYPENQQDWEDCAAEYGVSPDLNHYLTVEAAHDVDFVRARLGYDRIYVRGGSYGTRSGLEYLRQHPDHIAALVLDGLAPPDTDLFGEDVQMLARGVTMLVDECAADPACVAVSPTLLDDLLAVRAARAFAPNPILVGGTPYTEDEELFLIFLQQFLYTARARYDVPRAIHEAALGDAAAWYAIASDLFGVTIVNAGNANLAAGPYRIPPERRVPARAQEYVAPGLFATVMCAEFFPNSDGIPALEALASEQAWPSVSILEMARACAAWNVAPLAAELRAPVSSDVPVLLLSGEVDLNTLAEWGDHTMQTLPNATHLVVPYATHSVIGVPCGSELVVRYFQADGDINAVDMSCLDAIQHPGW